MAKSFIKNLKIFSFKSSFGLLTEKVLAKIYFFLKSVSKNILFKKKFYQKHFS
jgi:hypothetical protein